ncbi:spore morphogenesis/germination protein YwcE [Gracilibacillus alcaliphilus]|uniref:spore morphogenesis/germination protein YwcE n=1 Tax=Gracilibacillus alcaliphilus TaxID=1401441 RepID=UPI0019578EA0|nr:spore morphogenesis/germination protein YwcE [Gracilibacillus alcaliphilus]MBM7676396.1 hypothetical protein [Gracilibacillus alcaliphilus]
MSILLIFLLIFSFTPFLLWNDHWKKTAIGQIPFIIASWVIFIKHVTVGIAPNEMYLWGLFIANLIYGHISFTILLLELRKSTNVRRAFIGEN